MVCVGADCGDIGDDGVTSSHESIAASRLETAAASGQRIARSRCCMLTCSLLT